MPFARLTYLFNFGGQGWSETHWIECPTVNVFDATINAWRTYFEGLRAMLLPKACYGVGVRISVVGDLPYYRGSGIARANKTIGFDPVLQGPNQVLNAWGPELLDTAMNLNMVPNIGSMRSKTYYLHGLPDDAIRNGKDYIPGGLPQWDANLSVFLNALTLLPSMGWVGKPASSLAQPITALTETAGIITITAASMALTAPAGSVLPMTIGKLRRPGNLNGTIPMVVVSPTVVRTTRKYAAAAWDGKTGTIKYNGAAFTTVRPFSSIGIVDVTRRKVGRAFFVARGRRKGRKRA